MKYFIEVYQDRLGKEVGESSIAYQWFDIFNLKDSRNHISLLLRLDIQNHFIATLEWILDQYKEKTPKDPTIAQLFNTYKFTDSKEQVINLLQRVCTISIKTITIIQTMPTE
jgi:hypothetical protein